MNLTDADILEIRSAISAELAVSTRPLTFTIKAARRENVWLVVSITTHPNQRGRPVDESLEGSKVWWPEPKGGGEVFLVQNEDEDELWLSDVYGASPRAGGILQVYPPRFLDPLLAIWRNTAWTAKIQTRIHACPDSSTPNPPISSAPFPELRTRQREAFHLLRHTLGFLWGPPGTGKTTSLGAMLAAQLSQQPGARILLISSTNSAVDQAMVAIDEKLRQLGFPADGPDSPRARCKRIGQNFEAGYYSERRHLLPQRDQAAIQALLDHLEKRPSESDQVRFAAWRATEDSLRKRLREQNARLYSLPGLVGLTATRAAFDFDYLSQAAPFDCLVIDEASQVSLAYALALLPLGRAALFAGDPAQLAPIVQEKTPAAQRWLGESLFFWQEKLAPSSARVLLNEQSRMAPQICDVVGGAFYGGALQVCSRAEVDPKWKSQRQRATSGKAFTIVPVGCEGSFNAHWRGPIRSESAELAVQLCKDLLRRLEPEEVVILTPFRAQRLLIKKCLREADIRGVRVSTVHRAQGSERLAVIFDPVEGSSAFLAGPLGRRLFNVALSRAQGVAYLFVSSGDLGNESLRGIAARAGHIVQTPLLCELGGNSNYPWVLQGKTFGYLGRKLRFKRFNDDHSSVYFERLTGAEIGERISTQGMRLKCAAASQCPLTKGSSFKRCVD